MRGGIVGVHPCKTHRAIVDPGMYVTTFKPTKRNLSQMHDLCTIKDAVRLKNLLFFFRVRVLFLFLFSWTLRLCACMKKLRIGPS